MKRIPEWEQKVTGALLARGFPVGPVSPPLGSTDVGNVSQRCPTIQPLLAVTDDPIPWHTPEFAAACLTPKAEDAMRRHSSKWRLRCSTATLINLTPKEALIYSIKSVPTFVGVANCVGTISVILM
jgi:hypothetical protein